MNENFPINLLRELHFDDVYLTDEQDERLYEVLNASMSYERRVFDRYYVYHVPLEQIAQEEGRSTGQVMAWIELIAGNVDEKRHYILTGEY